jgi:hypothetical protein
MAANREIDTSDLTESSVKLAGRVQEKLNAGVRTFRLMRAVLVALSPIAVAAFFVGVYSMSLARKTDLAASDARVTAVEAKQAVQQSDLTHNHDDLLEMRKEFRDRLEHLEDIVRGIASQVGAPPDGVKPRNGRR